MGKTNLHVTAFNANGDILAKLKGWTVGTELTTEDGKGMADRFAKHIPTKRATKVSCELLHYVDTVPGSMLNIDVFTFDGSSILGNMKSATVTVSNSEAEVSGGADGDTEPNEAGTDITIEGEFVIASTADIMASLIDETVANWIANLVGTVVLSEAATVIFQAPMILTACEHIGQDRSAQRVRATWKLHGAVTTPSSGASTSLLKAAIYDPDSLSFYCTTGANAYASVGTPAAGLITQATLSYADGALTKEQFELAIAGPLAAS